MDSFLLLKNLQPNFDVLIPFLRFEKELENELLLSGKTIVFQNSKYFIVNSIVDKPLWAQAWLPACRLFPFKNKSEAVRHLKSFKNLGVHFETDANAKMALGLKKDLRELKLKRLTYEVPSKFNFKYFAWGLFDEEHLIICEHPFSQFPLGWHEFNEDKAVPPNRAYLKIWEMLCLNHLQLKPTDTVLDLGSSPGGWSWALSHHVKKVYSIDKAELDTEILKTPNIIYRAEDAFQVKPEDYTDCNWLFSDIICTPARLLTLVEHWQQFSKVENYACTIKFKGPCDFDILNLFKKHPDSKIIHLYQNKNEVTWIKQVKK